MFTEAMEVGRKIVFDMKINIPRDTFRDWRREDLSSSNIRVSEHDQTSISSRSRISFWQSDDEDSKLQRDQPIPNEPHQKWKTKWYLNMDYTCDCWLSRKNHESEREPLGLHPFFALREKSIQLEPLVRQHPKFHRLKVESWIIILRVWYKSKHWEKDHLSSWIPSNRPQSQITSLNQLTMRSNKSPGDKKCSIKVPKSLNLLCSMFSFVLKKGPKDEAGPKVPQVKKQKKFNPSLVSKGKQASKKAREWKGLPCVWLIYFLELMEISKFYDTLESQDPLNLVMHRFRSVLEIRDLPGPSRNFFSSLNSCMLDNLYFG